MAFICCFSTAKACDSCGCSTAGGGLGGLFYADQNMVGMRWLHTGFTATHFDSGLPIREDYQQVEWWMRYSFGKRLQVTGFVPYNSFSRKTGTDTRQLKGIGDVRVLANYTIWESLKGKDMTKMSRHILQIGGGIKFGTGQFEDVALEGDVPNTFQLGTGATNWLLDAIYNFKQRKIGFSANALLQIPSKNEYEYRYGLQFNTSMVISYEKQLGNIQLLPFVGTSFEYMDYDQRKGFEQHGTNGEGVFGLMGIEGTLNRFTASMNYYHPLRQSYADDEINAKGRGSLSIAYLF
ncbi:MAG: hypothetical protein ACPG49_08575 [Chitinophagales bacterium]